MITPKEEIRNLIHIYKHEIGELLEQVDSEKMVKYQKDIMKRWISDESTIQEIIDTNDTKEEDLWQVHERFKKADEFGKDHELYLCKNIRTDEFALFGLEGLKKYLTN